MATTLAEYKAAAELAYSDLGKCVKGKGTTNNCSDGQPLGASSFPSFGFPVDTSKCKICNSLKSCGTDCCEEKTCVDRGNAYNARLGEYNAALQNPATPPGTTSGSGSGTIASINNLLGGENASRNVIVVIVIGVLIGVAYWLYKKYGKQ